MVSDNVTNTVKKTLLPSEINNPLAINNFNVEDIIDRILWSQARAK